MIDCALGIITQLASVVNSVSIPRINRLLLRPLLTNGRTEHNCTQLSLLAIDCGAQWLQLELVFVLDVVVEGGLPPQHNGNVTVERLFRGTDRHSRNVNSFLTAVIPLSPAIMLPD